MTDEIQAAPDVAAALLPDSLPDDRLLTPAEVAAVFSVDPKTVSRWAADGRIASIRTPGRHRRISVGVVREALRKGAENHADAGIDVVPE